jgi:hypothetical protein
VLCCQHREHVAVWTGVARNAKRGVECCSLLFPESKLCAGDVAVKQDVRQYKLAKKFETNNNE